MRTPLLVLALLVTALPPLAAAAECPAYGGFGNLQYGNLVLTTQAGSTTVSVGAKALALGGSTTGTLDVEVNHACLESYRLLVSEVGGGVLYDVTTNPACGAGTDVHAVPFGLKVGEFEFFLTWNGCDGSAGSEYRKLIVVDPPLGV